MNSENLFNLLLIIPAFVAGLTVHEFAHAWMGNRLGDDTARRMGRLTLDPLKHLDPFGTLAFIIGSLSGFFFGWAKPVPFNPRNFQHPRRDAMLVALAGPISNLLQVPIWLGLLWLTARLAGPRAAINVLGGLAGEGQSFDPLTILMMMLMYGVIINFTLAAFNMIPLPPLDGHYVLEFLGPPAIGQFFDQIRPFSFIILLLIINLPAPYNIISNVLRPVQEFAFSLVFRAMGMSF